MKLTKWNIDPKNSEASFKVRKLMITTVEGQLQLFDGQAETKTQAFESINRICFKAEVNSIKTDDPKRDEHLRSADFFHMDKYPHILFVAEDFNVYQGEVETNLTIKNITKPVLLHVDFTKPLLGENGQEEVDVVVSGSINRREFGLTWDGTNQAGELIVGDYIKLSAKVKFVKQTENVPAEHIKECVL